MQRNISRRIPSQLLDWHRHVANVRARLGAHVPYKEALQIASDSYHGAGRRRVASQRPVVRRGSRKVSRRGSRKVSRRGSRKVLRRGAGFVSDIAHGVGAVTELLGLGRRKRATRRRPTRRTTRRGGAEYIAGRKRKTGSKRTSKRTSRRRITRRGGAEDIAGRKRKTGSKRTSKRTSRRRSVSRR